MTNPVCARCGCLADSYTASCRACYSRRRYRIKHPRPDGYREPVYTGATAGQTPGLNSLIPNRKEPK